MRGRTDNPAKHVNTIKINQRYRLSLLWCGPRNCHKTSKSRFFLVRMTQVAGWVNHVTHKLFDLFHFWKATLSFPIKENAIVQSDFKCSRWIFDWLDSNLLHFVLKGCQ